MNGLYEAAAAGVPVVGVPFFGDGEDNLEKAAGRGIGVTLGRGGLRSKKDGPSSSNLNNNNASDPTAGAGRLALALRAVLGDPTFAAEASRMAKGLRARALSTGRLPREEAADAVELGAWAWRNEREAERAAAAAAAASSPPSISLEKGKEGGETCASATE